MRILFLHNNFPAQFGAIARYLARQGWDVTYGTQAEDAELTGVRIVRFHPRPKPARPVHPYLVSVQNAVRAGQAMAREGLKLRRRGYRPDLVVAHSGWGPGLYIKDVWPNTRMVAYYEWYYQRPGVDSVFLGINLPFSRQIRARSRNTPILMDFDAADWGITPTHFQWSRFPEHMRTRMTIHHDGVDTTMHAPANGAPRELPRATLPDDAEVITYATRGMEPYRGFPQFMAALALVQKRRPRAHALIAGRDRVVYGSRPKDGRTYKEKALEEYDLDLKRVHFTDVLPRGQYVGLLQRSDVHVYLTVPFVLSWSLLEAMSTGCLVLASDVEPVREVMEDGRNGLLVDFFDIEGIANRICEALDKPKRFAHIRAAARQTILDRYDARFLYPQKQAIFEQIANGQTPPVIPPDAGTP